MHALNTTSPLIRRALHALAAAVLDAAPLLGFLMALGGMSYGLAFPDSAYFRVNGVLFLFWLPGWYAARWGLSSSDNDPISRFYHATLISFAIYAVLGTVGAAAQWPFTSFYLAYGLIIVGCFGWTVRTFPGCSLLEAIPAFRFRVSEILGVFLLVALAVLIYRWPVSNDIGQFFLQQSDMLVERSLLPSPIGMTAFGIDEPMPRWKSHLFHLFFSLLADATQLSLAGVLHQWATIPLGCCLLTALYKFCRSVCGPIPPAWTILAGILMPVLLLWRMFNAYDYAFRLTNSPCLDKDFALFYVYPTVLYLSLQAVRQPSAWWTGLLAAYAVPVLQFHPMTSVYLILAYPGFCAGMVGRVAIWKLFAIGGYYAMLFSVMVLSGHAQSFHHQIDVLTRRDMEAHRSGEPLHYWYGHYAAIPGIETDTVAWEGNRIRLRSRLLLDNSLILFSALVFPAWGSWLLFQYRRGKTLDVDEVTCFRWQAVWLLVLAAIWGLSLWLLGAAPHLYRGYERLHWFYLGFFSLIFPLAHFQQWLASLAISGTTGLRRTAGLLLPLLLAVGLIDQCLGLMQYRPTWVGRLPYINSLCDYLVEHEYSELQATAEHRRTHVGPLAPRPAWLHDEDRVLPLSLLPSQSAVWLQRQAVWWPELYAEAYAFARQGESRLDDVRRYHAVLDGRMTPESVQWVRDRRVTIVVAEDRAAYVLRLAAALNCEAVPLERSIWRLVPRDSR